MIAIIVYRLWFARGRDKRLFVLVMSLYYLLCVTVVYSAVGGDLQPADVVVTSSSSAAYLPQPPPSSRRYPEHRTESVDVRWTDRRRHLRSYCLQRQRLAAGRVEAGETLMAVRRRLSACPTADSPDHRLLATFLLLSAPAAAGSNLLKQLPPCPGPDSCPSSCELLARRRGVLRQLASPLTRKPGWTHVLLVYAPVERLAVSFLTESWPRQLAGNFSRAVDALLETGWSRDGGIPRGAEPITVACDVCRHVLQQGRDVVVLHLDSLEDELEALSQRHLLDGFVAVSDQDSTCSSTAPLLQQARYLADQLSSDQLRKIEQLYRDDLTAFPLYTDRASHRHRTADTGHDAL